jgi:hypothetical protein
MSGHYARWQRRSAVVVILGEDAVGAVVGVGDALALGVGGLGEVGRVVVSESYITPAIGVVHARLPLQTVVGEGLDVVLGVGDAGELIVEVVLVAGGPSTQRSAIGCRRR